MHIVLYLIPTLKTRPKYLFTTETGVNVWHILKCAVYIMLVLCTNVPIMHLHEGLIKYKSNSKTELIARDVTQDLCWMGHLRVWAKNYFRDDPFGNPP